ncbi:MAG TPA: T9SS type A sorting domain-containing protein, partial [Bacteroidetes bacterium]|nr:T9SS type A sorting domain-containing protein [Bacteroidota bacterium]
TKVEYIHSVQQFSLNYPSSAGFETHGDHFCYPEHWALDYPDIDFEMEWNHVTLFFTLDDSWMGESTFLWIQPFNWDYDPEKQVWYFDNISINSCPELCVGDPEIIEITQTDDCTYVFTASNTTGQTGVEYVWDFGDGSKIESGNPIEHNFMWSGEFEVYVTMDCGSQIRESQCTTVVVNTNCANCTSENITINAQSCNNGEGYLANFTLNIPDGYTICNDQFMWSDDVESIHVNSYLLDEDNNTLDVSINIVPDSGDPDFQNTVSTHLKLCPIEGSGDPICYEVNFSVNTIQCDQCNEHDDEYWIQNYDIIPDCVERNSNEKINVYEGTLDINDIPGFDVPYGFTYCENYSEEVGFEVAGNNGSVIDYRITTTKDTIFDFNTTLVFCRNEERLCYNVKFTVYEVCPKLKKWQNSEGEKGNGSQKEGYLSVEEPEDYNIMVFPNPVNHTLHVQINNKLNDGEIEIQFIDQYGRLLLTKKESNTINDKKIDISGISPGLYFIKIGLDNKYITTKKIIIVR